MRRADADYFAATDISAWAVFVLFDDRCFEPLFDEMEKSPIHNALGNDGQELLMRDAVEVFRKVSINDFGVALMERVGNRVHRVVGRLLWPKSVGCRTEISLEDRLDHEFHRHLGYAVANDGLPITVTGLQHWASYLSKHTDPVTPRTEPVTFPLNTKETKRYESSYEEIDGIVW